MLHVGPGFAETAYAVSVRNEFGYGIGVFYRATLDQARETARELRKEWAGVPGVRIVIARETIVD